MLVFLKFPLCYKFCIHITQYLEICLILYRMIVSVALDFELEGKFVKELNVRTIYRPKC
jgi:hypothetical protein